VKLRPLTVLLFLFAVSFTFFALQSGDVMMYLSLARDFLLKGEWPSHDPYLYSLTGADLHIEHEYLSYLIFYGAWALGGVSGLIFLKMLIYMVLFAIVLRKEPREQTQAALWMALWILAVQAGSFRFIERSSIFSDLLCIALVAILIEQTKITRGLVTGLTLMFVFWVQVHPGFPIGVVLLGAWAAYHSVRTPGFLNARVAWLLLPVAALMLNPIGIEGLLYPFRFAFHEAEVLKRHNFEWMPAYHPAFRWAPETLAFWALALAVIALVWRERAWFTLRALFALIAIVLAVQAVRFIPWASFALLIVVKPWARFRLRGRAEKLGVPVLVAVMAIVAVKNLVWGYESSSGFRSPKLTLDANFFPIETLRFLKTTPNPHGGRLYNAHDFGGYMIWESYLPIFHHGFVTDMDFYENDVVGIFKSPERFFEVAKKYNWTELLVDKHGSYPYFYKILSPLPDWKIVAEDDASYLIYYLPGGN
jgi:hypothetical protein